MEFRNTSAINPQRPEALVEMSSSALMADDGRVASETHLMNSLSIQIGTFGAAYRSTRDEVDEVVSSSREIGRRARNVDWTSFSANLCRASKKISVCADWRRLFFVNAVAAPDFTRSSFSMREEIAEIVPKIRRVRYETFFPA